MMQEKTLFTDGHEVTVTDSFFRVKKSFYELKGIKKHGVFIIHPDRLPAFLVILTGGMMITLGALRLIPGNLMSHVELFSIQLNPSSLVLSLGGVVFISGWLFLILMRDRYAIRIATAEGERNVVVSRKREYINQILDALNHAFLNLISPR